MILFLIDQVAFHKLNCLQFGLAPPYIEPTAELEEHLEKQKFLKHLANDEDEEIWKLLNSRVDNIEDKIKKTAHDLKDELHSDINESQKKSKNDL